MFPSLTSIRFRRVRSPVFLVLFRFLMTSLSIAAISRRHRPRSGSPTRLTRLLFLFPFFLLTLLLLLEFLQLRLPCQLLFEEVDHGELLLLVEILEILLVHSRHFIHRFLVISVLHALNARRDHVLLFKANTFHTIGHLQVEFWVFFHELSDLFRGSSLHAITTLCDFFDFELCQS